jgi:predicted nucleic acid-binding protein
LAWVDQLRGQVVGLDTAPIIYFIEENPTYLERINAFFESMAARDFRAVTSIITLLEVLVHPFRRDDVALAGEYRDILLNSQVLTTVSLNQEIAEEAARLRARYNIRTPDAIQVAATVSQGATFFLTNDSRLPAIPGLQIIELDKVE